ncbi:MAG: XdhC family protein [Chloroflexi bacterium]|nr:MAG: XdhC family protein [Chloroflexota bacterium]
MREVLEEVKSWTAAGDRVALATVVETWGSSPRPLGSKMVVSSSGRMAGSVSNGCIEGDVFEEAQRVLKAGQARLVPYGVADDVAFEVGLACGGHVEVMIQPVGPEHLRLIELIESERPAELRTNLETGEVQLLERVPAADAPTRDGDWFIEPHRRAPQL